MLETFGLTDHQNVLEVDLLGMRRGRHRVVWWLLRFHSTGLNRDLRTEKGERKQEEDPKTVHAASLQT